MGCSPIMDFINTYIPFLWGIIFFLSLYPSIFSFYQLILIAILGRIEDKKIEHCDNMWLYTLNIVWICDCISLNIMRINDFILLNMVEIVCSHIVKHC